LFRYLILLHSSYVLTVFSHFAKKRYRCLNSTPSSAKQFYLCKRPNSKLRLEFRDVTVVDDEDLGKTIF